MNRVLSKIPHAVKNYVSGGSLSATGTSTSFNVPNAALGNDLTSFTISGTDDVNAAVASAKIGQHLWQQTPPAEKAHVMRRAASILRERVDELAALECLDTGRPLKEMEYDIACAWECLEYMSSICQTTATSGEHILLGGTGAGASFGFTRREPLGVCAGIGAWNYPLQSAVWKSAPALACGNALVFKPAENTPLLALALAEVYTEAGIPDGCFNVVLGDGSTGSLLSSHPDIAKVSFTGSVNTGKAVYQSATATMKSATMELGGKSPLIIMDDADLENSVSAAMMANWYSCGEVCSNGTRVFVQRKMMDSFLPRLMERTSKLKIGDPFDPTTDVGALISKTHLDRVMEYVSIGNEEGANLLCGGETINVGGDCQHGAFMSPAIFTECNDEMRIVKEEIFGPVMTVLPFDDEEEVLERANDSPFGLSAGVFTKDLNRAHRMVASLDAGTMWINNYNLAPTEMVKFIFVDRFSLYCCVVPCFFSSSASC
jgi:betaine-aldehyde dehydrogenase